MNKKLKRIATDTAGYLLIVLGVALGPLPGPGGIPIILAGLGLLSINNSWARELREYLLEHGGKAVQVLFPPRRSIQILYDILVGLLLILVAVMAYRRDALWQIGLAAGLFFLALFIAVMNRDRANRLRRKITQA